MDHHQRELRQAAAKAFKQSLDQLADCFQPETETDFEPDQLEALPLEPDLASSTAAQSDSTDFDPA